MAGNSEDFVILVCTVFIQSQCDRHTQKHRQTDTSIISKKTRLAYLLSRVNTIEEYHKIANTGWPKKRHIYGVVGSIIIALLKWSAECASKSILKNWSIIGKDMDKSKVALFYGPRCRRELKRNLQYTAIKNRRLSVLLFLADRTNGRAYETKCLFVCLSSAPVIKCVVAKR